MQEPPPPTGPQPPFGQPQPPFGQPPGGPPPYAPPPRRGPGPLMYCLGCMGVAAVVAVAIVLFGYFSVRKAMTPITAANVQSMLPPGVPLYPGFSPVLEKQSRSINLPSKAGAHRLVALAFNTRDDMSVIGPWYQARLAPAGWVGGVSPTYPDVYQFKKGDTVISLKGQPGAGGQKLVVMSIAEGVPEGSLGTPASP